MKKVCLVFMSVIFVFTIMLSVINMGKVNASTGFSYVSYNEDQELVIGKKTTFEVKYDSYGSGTISKKVKFTENTVLQFDIDTNNFSFAIGKRIDYGMRIGKHVFDSLYVEYQYRNETSTDNYPSLYYIPKGT